MARLTRASLSKKSSRKNVIQSDSESESSNSVPQSPSKVTSGQTSEPKTEAARKGTDFDGWSDSSLTPQPDTHLEQLEESIADPKGPSVAENVKGAKKTEAEKPPVKLKLKKEKMKAGALDSRGSIYSKENTNLEAEDFSTMEEEELKKVTPKINVRLERGGAPTAKAIVDNAENPSLNPASSKANLKITKSKNKRTSTTLDEDVGTDETPKRTKLPKINKGAGSNGSNEKVVENIPLPADDTTKAVKELQKDKEPKAPKPREKKKEGPKKSQPTRKKPSRKVILEAEDDMDGDDDDDLVQTAPSGTSSSQPHPQVKVAQTKETSPTKIKLPSSPSSSRSPSPPPSKNITKTPALSTAAQSPSMSSLTPRTSTPSVPGPAAAAKPKPKAKALAKQEGIESSGTPLKKLLGVAKRAPGTASSISGGTPKPKSAPSGAAGLLARTFGALEKNKGVASDEKGKGKESDRKKERERWAWDDEWVMTAAERKDFDDSRKLREVERRKRDAYSANPINLQESEDAFRADRGLHIFIDKNPPTHRSISTEGCSTALLEDFLGF